MGHGKNYSSESDEDTNVRHDRFRSERFKDSNSNLNNQNKTKSREHTRSYAKDSSKKYRDRSPTRSHLSRNNFEKKISRKNCDDVNHHLNSNKYGKSDPRTYSSPGSSKSLKDYSYENKERDDSSGSKNSKKLSSILKNFDKKIESKRLSNDTSMIGPSLPPHLAKKVEEETTSDSRESNDPTSVGPVPHSVMDVGEDSMNDKSKLPDKLVENEVKDISSDVCKNQSAEETSLLSMGPALPPHLQKKNNETEESSGKLHEDQKLNQSSPVKEKDEKSYGPALPPKLQEDYGPALPPNFKTPAVQGPMLPEGMTSEDLERMEEESEDEDTFGPLPVGKMNMTQYQLELRAMDIKRKLEEEKSGSSKDIKKREEWMLELPPEKASNLGLGPRSFRMKEGPDMSNRSAWTDTPAEKKRKEEMALRGEAEPVNSEEVMRSAFVQERNETMEKISKLSREEDRQKSLLEIHQKKLKKKKKKEEKEGKKKERRPFDRNIDLQVNRFDEAQKKAIFKKAQLLDTRFSSGESKFL